MADEKTYSLTQDLISSFPVLYTAGGAGQNTIRAAQWKLPSNSTVYVSCVGKDDFAELLKSNAQADGVSVHYMVDETKPTGTCATLLTDQGHHRSLVANLGAALSMNASFIKSNENLLTEASILYVTGFLMNVSIDAVLHIAKHALEHDKIFALNLSAPFVSQFYGKELMQAYEYADLVFGNESELHQFALLNEMPEDSHESLVRRMANLPKKSSRKRIVVITHGAEPTTVSDGTEILQFPVNPIPESEFVDANGAGDAFCGGFLAAVMQGKSLEEAVLLGHEVAGFIIRTSGIVFPRK